MPSEAQLQQLLRQSFITLEARGMHALGVGAW